MKKYIAFPFGFLTVCLFVFGQPQSAAFRGDSRSKIRSQADDDRKLAETIKKVTNRSAEGLTQKRMSGRSVRMDLEGRFQNAMLVRMDDYGKSESACIGSLGEANAFFGRDLETGAELPRTEFPAPSAADIERQYGMSVREFNFYSELIKDAEIRRSLSPESATLTIQNADGAAEGFNDATVMSPEGGNAGTTLGQLRLNVFNYAASIWGAFLDTNVPIVINSKFDPLACSAGSAVLGSAGTAAVNRDFSGAPISGTWYHIALANKLGGVDYTPGNAEINATFSSNFDTGCFAPGHRFYYGLDNSTPASRTNLLVVVLHEMGHGLGFSSLVDGSTGTLFSGFPDVYTQFMYDRTVGLKWSQMTDAQRQTSKLNNGNVFWDGPNVKIASGYLTAGREAGTGRVQLYTPTSFAAGSSISHFDISASPNLLMEPNINSGLAMDGDLTRQQLRDIGWFRDTTADKVADTVTAVTPNSGFAFIGEAANITWTNSGSFNRNITIELSTDGGATYPTVIASNIVNTGSYSWTTPNSPTTNARIRVREYDFAAPSGTSSANFSILFRPTAARVGISGQVADGFGRGIGQALVTMTDSNGKVSLASTNPFGYYRFDTVTAGEGYIVAVTHRRFRFEPRFLTVSDQLTNVDFTPLP